MTADPLRQIILKTIHQTQSGDIGLSLAMIDLAKALYLSAFNERLLLRYNVNKPQDSERDRVIWSNGTSWPALLAVLKEAGFDVNEYEIPYFKTQGVSMVSHVPGYGLAMGIGMAKSLLLSKQDARVFVFLDDDDLSCGTTWEAIMAAGYERLGNLTVICGFLGTAKLEPLQDKFEAFLWKVLSLVSGHDMNVVTNAIHRAYDVQRKPTVLLAPVVLGKGVPFAEHKEEYRGAFFSSVEMEEALNALS